MRNINPCIVDTENPLVSTKSVNRLEKLVLMNLKNIPSWMLTPARKHDSGYKSKDKNMQFRSVLAWNFIENQKI